MSRAARAEMECWSWRTATLKILRSYYPAAVLARRREEARWRQRAAMAMACLSGRASEPSSTGH